MTNVKTLEKVTIKAEYSRRYPDPLNKSSDSDPLNIEHHILVSRAIDVPEGISKAPNPRAQNTDRAIYKEVRESLDNAADLSFHLKNKGITVLAHHVEYSTDKKTVYVYLGEGDGIVDGAHTYQIILEAQAAGTCPEGQYVKLEVLTGIPSDMGPEITGGLNTAVQVEDASLMNLEGAFDWIKEALKKTDFGDRIAYKQNEDKPYDIRGILALMTIFNVKEFPYPGSHPKDAYVSKARCLELYNENQDSFKMLKPILVDILLLHDYIHIQSREIWNKKTGGRAGGMIGLFTPKKKRSNYPLVFMGGETEQKLYDGALYPMLGAMRFLVERKDGEDVYSWRLMSFDDVKSFFDEVASDLVATTYNTSLHYGRKPNPIGKDENHWDNMYKTVALHFYSKYSSK
jgi:hypothetical protein